MAKSEDEKPESLPDGEASGAKTDASATQEPELSPKQIRDARKQADLTQAELAKELDVSTRTVARWESGDSKPSEAQTLKITEMAIMIGGAGMAAIAARALFAPWLGGPLGIAAMGAGAAWFARNPAAKAPKQPILPDAIRDALLTWADQLDLSPRKLREAIAALLASAAKSGLSAKQLRDLLAHEAELPNAVRATMLAAADGLDLSPRKLRNALIAVLNAAAASELNDAQLQALLLGAGSGAEG